MASCESGFMIYILLDGLSFIRVHFRFGMEGVWRELSNIDQASEVYLATFDLGDNQSVSCKLFF